MDIEKTFEIPFAPGEVYAAWVSPDTVIPPASAMDIDPVVGGRYRLTARGDGFEAQNEGEFLEVEDGRHLRYTWEWNKDGRVTEVEVDFEPTDSGTRLTLAHRGFDDQASFDNHDSGWDSYLKGLVEFMGTAGASR